MEKSQPIPTNLSVHADQESTERVQVTVEVNRCPYCRDDVRPIESVVCQACLTRHHPDCWDEAGRCSSCSSEVPMQAGRVESPRIITEEDIKRILEKEGYRSEEIAAYLEQRDEEAGEECGWGGCHDRARFRSVLGSNELCLKHARRSAHLGKEFFLVLTIFCLIAVAALVILGRTDPAAAIVKLVLGLAGILSLLAGLHAEKRLNALKGDALNSKEAPS